MQTSVYTGSRNHDTMRGAPQVSYSSGRSHPQVTTVGNMRSQGVPSVPAQSAPIQFVSPPKAVHIQNPAVKVHQQIPVPQVVHQTPVYVAPSTQRVHVYQPNNSFFSRINPFSYFYTPSTVVVGQPYFHGRSVTVNGTGVLGFALLTLGFFIAEPFLIGLGALLTIASLAARASIARSH